MSPVTCHLITVLYSFNCYESARVLSDVAAEGLVKERIKLPQIFTTNNILKLFPFSAKHF